MEKIKTYFLLFVAFPLCLTAGLTGCKNNETSPTTDAPVNSETQWQDENVDNDGWT